jgi:voltage-gated potassium channel
LGQGIDAWGDNDERRGGMTGPDRQWILAVAFTVLLLLLVAFAITRQVSYFFFLLFLGIGGAATFFVILFPGSRFFSIALANYLAVYACIFTFFSDANFQTVSTWTRLIGFVSPIIAFLCGAWWRRREIREIVTSEEMTSEHRFGSVFLWLLPVFAIGAMTFLLRGMSLSPMTVDLLFLVAMTGISVIVLLVSESVAAFLLDTGILFEGFFQRMSRLLVPAFAFFTFYSLLVIIFASIYRVLDRLAPGQHFIVENQQASLQFTDSLYFSIVTLSTVGYGDIAPASDLVRVIVALQIICGVLLLLFGFSEIIAYARDRRSHRHIE